MSFSTLLLSTTMAGLTTLAFAVAAPASAQEHYAHRHYAHRHYAHARYRRHHYAVGRQIIVHPQAPVAVQSPSYAWGPIAAPVAAVGNVVGGTGQAVEGVFTGAGSVVSAFVGGVFGGTAALFGYPPSYTYGAPLATPFNAAGAVAAAPFQVVSTGFGAPVPRPAYPAY